MFMTKHDDFNFYQRVEVSCESFFYLKKLCFNVVRMVECVSMIKLNYNFRIKKRVFLVSFEINSTMKNIFGNE